MKIYWFERHDNDVNQMPEKINDLEKFGFDGVMYPYGYYAKDYFTKISRTIDAKSNFQYIVAIRTYTISPQYLTMLCNSIDDISPDRISLNLLTGWPYDYEKKVGGILGDINDDSNNISRSNYMIEFAKTLSSMKPKSPKFYVSTTNESVFNICMKNNFNMILPYSIANKKNIKTISPIISLAPIFDKNLEKKYSDSDFFNKETFLNFLESQSDKAEAVLLFENSKGSQYDTIKHIVSEYKLNRKENR
jgi:hypothetical protein